MMDTERKRNLPEPEGENATLREMLGYLLGVEEDDVVSAFNYYNGTDFPFIPGGEVRKMGAENSALRARVAELEAFRDDVPLVEVYFAEIALQEHRRRFHNLRPHGQIVYNYCPQLSRWLGKQREQIQVAMRELEERGARFGINMQAADSEGE